MQTCPHPKCDQTSERLRQPAAAAAAAAAAASGQQAGGRGLIPPLCGDLPTPCTTFTARRANAQAPRVFGASAPSCSALQATSSHSAQLTGAQQLLTASRRRAGHPPGRAPACAAALWRYRCPHLLLHITRHLQKAAAGRQPQPPRCRRLPPPASPRSPHCCLPLHSPRTDSVAGSPAA